MKARRIIRALPYMSLRQAPLMFYSNIHIETLDTGDGNLFFPTITEGIMHLLSRAGSTLVIEERIQSRWGFVKDPRGLRGHGESGIRIVLERDGQRVVVKGFFPDPADSPDDYVVDYTQANPPLNLVGRSRVLTLELEHDRRSERR